MSDEENASSELQPPAGETSTAQNATNTNTNTNSTPTLPTGLKLPQPLKMEGNLAANWKRFKRAWQNYSVIARLDKFEENYKTALFLSVIGEEALEVFEGMDFSSGTDKQVLSKVIEKFEEFCIGETNETYERFIFNRRNQEENESIDQYVTVIRKLAQTCNFCNCLNDSLLRDRLVLGIKDESTRKKLLQEKKLTLSRAIDIGRSGEKTNLRLKELKKPGGADDEVNVVKYNKKKENERQSKSQETRRGSCRYCGGNHRRGACPAYGQTCHNCGRKNHFSQVCLQKRKLPANVVTQYNHPDDSDEDSGEYVATLDLHPQQEKILIVKSGQYQSKIHTTMKIKGGQNTSFQVDTGATCNVIRRKELLGTKYEKNITKTNQVLRMYNSSPLIPTGICYVQLTNPANGQKYNVRFVVVDEKDADINLLGSRAVQQMKLIQVNHRNIQTDTHEVQAVGNQGPSEMVNDASAQGHQSKGALTKEEILKKYPDVFEGLGDLGEPLHLEVDDMVTPVQIPPRRIPQSLKQPLKDHLCELEEQGIIQKVGEPTEWVSSIVVNKKNNGKIRLCLDPQPLNKALKRCHYPIPTIEEVLPDLHDAKVFSKVDCKNGYWQIKLDQESSMLTTFNTPFGRYRWNRMPFGIAPAGEIFQRRLDQAIEGLEGVRTIADDILIIGNGETTAEAVKDHDAKLEDLLSRCQERGIKLNEEKIELKKTSMAYIGHLLTADGVRADPSKVEAILQMTKPQDVQGVRRILGMTNYLAKFLPRLSEISEPLRQLTRKEKEFSWSAMHDKAFNDIKDIVSKPPLLKYYEPEKPLLLQCDASEKGLGVSLMQQGKPIAYASRALTDTEINYAQIEKELLAIVFGVERFHQYTYGRKVIVDSDHKPLETIFGKPLATAPRRLQKMFMRLQGYDIDIQYKKGSEMYLADTLSRHFVEGQPARSEFEEEIEKVPLTEEINQVITSEEKLAKLQSETAKDEILQNVKQFIQAGWPDTKNELTPTLTNYFHIRDELVVQDNIIMRGERVVIPKSLRKQTLEDLHTAHQGVESTLRRARESIYWPNMNSDLKEYISRCETCNTFPSRQQKEPLLNHEVPNQPWAKIGTDLFQFENKEYLVTVDYFSNFFEVDRLGSTTSGAIITKLKGHIARYGIPDEVVSDNGPQYDSDEFRAFAQSYGFKHTRTSPHHPQSNGKAESAVKQAKKILRMTKESGTDYYLALLNVRNTPQEGHISSPVQRLMNRRTRTTLPISKNLMQPRVPENTRSNIVKKQLKQQKYYNRGAKELGQLRKGDRVKIQPVNLGKKRWIEGEVKRKVQPRSYEVEANGKVYIRNRKHLRKCGQRKQSHVEDEMPTAEKDEENITANEETVIEEEPKEQQPQTEPIANQPVQQEDEEYRTRSGRISRKPARFGESREVTV